MAVAKTPPDKSATRAALLALQEEIRQGELAPGDRLPPERDLAPRLGISRSTLREVINALVALNVLETRQGSGVYVRSLAFDELLAPVTFALELNRPNLESLFEARLGLEPLAAELAARRATPEAAAEIVELATLIAAPRLSMDRFIEIDTRFHLRIASATENTLLAQMIQSMDYLYRRGFRLTLKLPGIREGVADGHDEIAAAISKRRPRQASLAMTRHIERVRTAIAQASPEAFTRPAYANRASAEGRSSSTKT